MSYSHENLKGQYPHLEKLFDKKNILAPIKNIEVNKRNDL